MSPYNFMSFPLIQSMDRKRSLTERPSGFIPFLRKISWVPVGTAEVRLQASAGERREVVDWTDVPTTRSLTKSAMSVGVVTRMNQMYYNNRTVKVNTMP